MNIHSPDRIEIDFGGNRRYIIVALGVRIGICHYPLSSLFEILQGLAYGKAGGHSGRSPLAVEVDTLDAVIIRSSGDRANYIVKSHRTSFLVNQRGELHCRLTLLNHARKGQIEHRILLYGNRCRASDSRYYRACGKHHSQYEQEHY